MAVKEAIFGTILTVVIGGAAYTVNKEDVVDNFADDTGLSQQQAEEYVDSVGEEDLVPYSELGAGYVKDGNDVLGSADEIGCVNYDYEWVSPTLSCEEGKDQLEEFGRDEIALGNAYIRLGSDSASRADMTTTISILNEVNADYGFEIVEYSLDDATITENKKSNSYNKATLEAALESE